MLALTLIVPKSVDSLEDPNVNSFPSVMVMLVPFNVVVLPDPLVVKMDASLLTTNAAEMGSGERTDVPFRSILTGPEGEEPPTNVYVTEPGLELSVKPSDGMSSPRANNGANAMGAATAMAVSSRRRGRSENCVIILPLYDLDMIGFNLKRRIAKRA